MHHGLPSVIVCWSTIGAWSTNRMWCVWRGLEGCMHVPQDTAHNGHHGAHVGVLLTRSGPHFLMIHTYNPLFACCVVQVVHNGAVFGFFQHVGNLCNIYKSGELVVRPSRLEDKTMRLPGACWHRSMLLTALTWQGQHCHATCCYTHALPVYQPTHMWSRCLHELLLWSQLHSHVGAVCAHPQPPCHPQRATPSMTTCSRRTR